MDDIYECIWMSVSLLGKCLTVMGSAVANIKRLAPYASLARYIEPFKNELAYYVTQTKLRKNVILISSWKHAISKRQEVSARAILFFMASQQR